MAAQEAENAFVAFLGAVGGVAPEGRFRSCGCPACVFQLVRIAAGSGGTVRVCRRTELHYLAAEFR